MITNHAYFNLNGEGNIDILSYLVKINSKSFAEIDSTSFPTGKLKNANKIPFDFLAFKSIYKDIEMNDEQLKNGNDYNKCALKLNKSNNPLNFGAAAIGDYSKI